MKIKFVYYLIFLTYFFGGCTIEKEDMIGTYNSPNLKNNIDTLILHKNGKYERKLYYNDKLILHQNDHWKYNNGRLTLDDFFLDQDDIYSPQRTFKSGLIRVTTSPEKHSGLIEIDYSQIFEHKYYYRKIE